MPLRRALWRLVYLCLECGEGSAFAETQARGRSFSRFFDDDLYPAFF
jgi:hypothetical protein